MEPVAGPGNAPGARIVHAAPGPTLVIGYGNGYVGYLADAGAHEQGTYEALASPFASSAGERVVEGAVALIDHVRAEIMAGPHGV